MGCSPAAFGTAPSRKPRSFASGSRGCESCSGCDPARRWTRLLPPCRPRNRRFDRDPFPRDRWPPGPLAEPFAVESAARGVSDLRGRYGSATRDTARGGVSGAAHSLHQHCQQPARTRRRSPPRTQRPGCTRGIALATRSAVSRRECAAVAAWCLLRHCVRRVVGPRDGLAVPELRGADRARSRGRPARAGDTRHGGRRCHGRDFGSGRRLCGRRRSTRWTP